MSLASAVRDFRFAWSVLRKQPINCLVQVTNRCNMKCSFCDFWPNVAANGEELTLEDHRRVSDELAELGCCLISIEGGEPFVRADLAEIVRAWGRRHLPTLFTNGWYVTPENARALFDAGMSHVSVSVDYPDAERHDAKRGLPGAFDRAWNAVELFRRAAPQQSQVHVMTVLMDSNWKDLEALLRQSAERGVGHYVTLISVTGFRRGKGVDAPPPWPISDYLMDLWRRYPHFQTFGGYLEKMDAFLGRAPLPTCRAGVQSLNIDHVGNVNPCIEKINWTYGNVKREPLRAIFARMAADRERVSACHDCGPVCRGFSQLLGDGGAPGSWYDLATRMRSS